MKIDCFCFILGLLIIPASFLFFPKLYFNRRLILPLYTFTFILAVIGMLAPNNQISSRPNFYQFLFCPIYSLTILRLQLFVFKKKLKRYPKNPPRNFFMDEDELGWDRLFYFVFLMLSVTLPIGLLAYFYH